MQKIILNKGINKTNINEYLFVLYLYIYTILAGIIFLVPSISFYLLLTTVGFIMFLSLYFNKFKMRYINCISFIAFFVFFTMILDLLFRRNMYIFQYMYYFIIFGIIPMYLCGQVRDFKKVIELYSKASLLVFILYFWDPYIGYKIFNDYMSYGFNLALPTFCGIYIGSKFFRYKYYNVIMILSFAQLMFFSNKGAILAGIVFVVLYNLIVEKWQVKHIYRIIFLICIVILIAINLVEILNYLIVTLDNLDINSYSIRTLRNMVVTNEYVQGLSNRDIIWKDALIYFKKNILIGSGTATFQSLTGTYPHNLIIDILCQYGILGLIIFVVCICNTLRKWMFSKIREYRLFAIMSISIGVIPLITSMIFYQSMFFWIFIFIGYKKLRRKGYEDNISKL